MARRIGIVGLLAVACGPSWAVAEDLPPARVRVTEPTVTLQSASDAAAEEAVPNLPFLPGDRVWTDANGRVEFHFADGSRVRLDRRSKLDYQSAGRSRRRRHRPAALVGKRVRAARATRADGALRDRDAERHRRPARGRRLPAGRRRAARRACRCTRARRPWTRASRSAWAPVSGPSRDAGRGLTAPTASTARRTTTFARWNTDLGEDEAWASGGPEELPEEVSPYAEDFARNGSWYFEAGVGQRLAAARVDRLAALRPRPLGVDGVRLDLGSERDLGLGALPLRALGPFVRARLVLDSGPYLGPGLGGLVGRRVARGLAAHGVPWASRRAGAGRRCPAAASATAGPTCGAETWARATSRSGAFRARPSGTRGCGSSRERAGGSGGTSRSRTASRPCRATSAPARGRATRWRSCAPTP